MTNTFKNLPVKALEWAVKDKLTMSVFCVLVKIKVFRWHGVYKFVSLNQFCKDFGVNKNKAKRILVALRTIRYNGKPLCVCIKFHGTLYIRTFSFRSLFDYKGIKYVCKNIAISKSDFEGKRLFDVERWFKCMLFKNKVYSREKIGKKAARQHDAEITVSFRHSQLSLKNISKYLGTCRNTACKYVGKMKSNHEISVVSFALELVGRGINPEDFQDYGGDGFIVVGRSVFKRKCNEYKLNNGEDISRFKCKTYRKATSRKVVIPHNR